MDCSGIEVETAGNSSDNSSDSDVEYYGCSMSLLERSECALMFVLEILLNINYSVCSPGYSFIYNSFNFKIVIEQSYVTNIKRT